MSDVFYTTAILGVAPDRYGYTGGEIGHDIYFSMARGNANLPAMEMTNWFDTHYHFIVPEFGPNTKFSYGSHNAASEYKEAKVLGVDTVPVLIGPVIYLLLSKPAKGVEKSFSPLSLLPNVLPVYKEVIAELKKAGTSWIQFDELALLESFFSGLNVLIETYFADVPAAAYKTLTSLSGVSRFGFDLVRGTKTLDLIKRVVDRRNIWANDLAASLSILGSLEAIVGKDKLLDDEIKSWLAFAAQKIVEVDGLAKAFGGQKNEMIYSMDSRSFYCESFSNFSSNAPRIVLMRFSPMIQRFSGVAYAPLVSPQAKLLKPLLAAYSPTALPTHLRARLADGEIVELVEGVLVKVVYHSWRFSYFPMKFECLSIAKINCNKPNVVYQHLKMRLREGLEYCPHGMIWASTKRVDLFSPLFHAFHNSCLHHFTFNSILHNLTYIYIYIYIRNTISKICTFIVHAP
ncbi:unnamed protein product [Spirodela intermedia]|uniref:Cobalamin-independent methionine synthase MetE N-terminal domain-containing protein n=1 Tax=Spirodela intermedia TaxID=51605 RepID=A0A7I8IH13_SPIIN|nr:unnamed protein product [Spirodela intermedia]CAA6657160.1 unnamed protein product [Spirodela intermedia]